MRRKGNERYWKIGLTGIAVIAVSLLCFFAIFRIEEIARGFQRVTEILAPFLYGAAIAYLLAPACGRIEGLLGRIVPDREKHRGLISGLSILITLILVLALLWALFMMVIPQVCRSIIDLAMTLPDQIRDAIAALNEQLVNRPEWQEPLNRALLEVETRFQTWMEKDLVPTAQAILNDLGGRIVGVVTVLKNLLLGVIVSIYLLASRKRFAVQARMLLYSVFPRPWAETIEGEVRYADRMFSGFLIGKLLDSAIIGLICFVGTSILGFPSALLISVVIGVTNIIPFFGPFIGAIPCALLLLLENPWHCLSFVIFIVILQQVDGNIIGPKILSGSTGLSGFWVLFSILLFGGLWGFVGMIVGVPLFAVIYDIVRRMVYHGLARHGAQDLFGLGQDAPDPERPEEAAAEGADGERR